jgi:hypothetical protein
VTELKFNDVVIASALLFVSNLLFDAVLFVSFASLNNSYMIIVAGIISALITSIVTGYIFAIQINEESKLKAIGSIVILMAAGLLVFTAAWNAIPLVSPEMQNAMQSMFSTSGWTYFDWFAYVAFTMFIDVVLTVVFALVGLYVGSMLKRKKT